jgi:ketosteroid isomerase-like protein
MSIRAAVVAILLVSFSVAVPKAQGQSIASDADFAAIRKTIDNFLAAFNRHDAQGWAAPFAEDGDFTNVTGLTRHGRKEVEERFAGLFATSLRPKFHQ